MLRWIFGALSLALLLVAGDTRASVSIAVSWAGLLRESTAAVMATPHEARSVWEDGRIYTYTSVHVDRAIAGDLATGDDAWVRTMGGVVGKIGQIVDGEPVLTAGHSSLLFLHRGPVGTFEVTARGQGQFPRVVDDAATGPGKAYLVRSTAVGALVAPRVTHAAPATTAQSPTSPTVPMRLAADVVHGRAVDDVAREIADEWKSMHATHAH